MVAQIQIVDPISALKNKNDSLKPYSIYPHKIS